MIPTFPRFTSPRSSPRPSQSFSSYFYKHCFVVEAIPIWFVSGAAVVGGLWYLTRLARSPDVIWDRKGNPTPWMDVKPNQQVKLYAVNQHYDGEPYKRKSL